MQLIFLFETNKKSKSDYKYVRSYLIYAGLDRKFKFSPIYMNGKGNYNKFEYQINSLKKDYQGGSKVIMFVDVDSTSLDHSQVILNNEIIKYCNDKNYELVWFKRTIEEVFWGEKVSQNKKNDKANDFLKKNRISKIDFTKLNKENYNDLNNSESNLKNVIDKIVSTT